jgi:trehalose/maltose hydrolase-like predicted phosphorylase
VSDVFHFAVTRWVSRKKKAVAATSAIEIIQNDTPTKSSDFRTVPDEAKAVEGTRRTASARSGAFLISDFMEFCILGG